MAFSPASVLAAGVAPGNASSVQREQAQAKFVRGKELFGQKKYDEALAEFRASMDIVQSPNARLYLARALRENGRLVEAYVEFGRTAVEANELAPQDPRYAKAGESAAVERKALEPKLAFVTVTLEHPGKDTVLRIGGEQAKPAEPAPVMPGNAEVVVETPSHETIKKSFTLKAGDKQAVTIDAAASDSESVAKPETTTSTTSTSTTSDSGALGLRPFAYVAAGIGVVGLAGFTIFGLSANSKYDDLKGCSPRCAQSDVDSGKSSQRLANVGLVLGIVGLGVGATLFVMSMPGPADSKAGAQVGIGPGSLYVRGQF